MTYAEPVRFENSRIARANAWSASLTKKSRTIALLTEEFERRGMFREDACYAARRQFGGTTQLKEWDRENRLSRGRKCWRAIFVIPFGACARLPVLHSR